MPRGLISVPGHGISKVTGSGMEQADVQGNEVKGPSWSRYTEQIAKWVYSKSRDHRRAEKSESERLMWQLFHFMHGDRRREWGSREC